MYASCTGIGLLLKAVATWILQLRYSHSNWAMAADWEEESAKALLVMIVNPYVVSLVIL